MGELDAIQALSFAGAVAALFFGHVLRAIRWRIILRHGRVYVGNFRPLVSLSIGYLVNALVPFRLGEIVRGASLAYTAKSDFFVVMATIVFERTLDLLVIGILLAALFIGDPASLAAAAQQILLGLIALGLAIAVARASFVRQALWSLASVFNDTIKTSILHFFWSLSDLWTKSGLALKWSFWALTLVMWAAYALSVALLALTLDDSWLATLSAIYLVPLEAQAWGVGAPDSAMFLLTMAYLAAPVLVVIAHIFFKQLRPVGGLRQAMLWVTDPARYVEAAEETSVPRFHSFQHYGSFLDRKFRNENSSVLEFEDKAVGDALVHRIFHGGSSAVTALLEVESQLRVRKYANGEGARKLIVQRKWLEEHKDELPIVNITGARDVPGGTLYDMEYIGGTRDLYEAIHTEPLAASETLFTEIITRMRAFHDAHRREDADEDVLRGYVEVKACQNLRLIREALPEFFTQELRAVNGRAFDDQAFRVFETPAWLIERLRSRSQSIVHGDLTIENILLTPRGDGARWFLIDSNSENGFETPLIDFAKLMQSLHLGYESLNRDPRSSFRNGELFFNMHKSAQYSHLEGFFVRALENTFGAATTQEIYLHEIINYLRLVPYQLRRSRDSGVAFFGALCTLLLDYEARYPGDLKC